MCSKNKQALYNEWQKAIAEKKQLSDIKGELENKFKAYEVMGNANTGSNQEATTVEYFTDEDELAEATEWIRVKNKSKKQKMTTSPTPHQQQRGISEPPRQKDTKPPHR
jgi:predicted MPP superfamily phosphohydrolase